MKQIILCADDYGQNESISQAIITLLEKKRLSATSCMTTAPYWPQHAKWLHSFKDKAQIGLHFNLTEGAPLSSSLIKSHGFMSLSKLLIQAYSGRLNAAAIEAELHAQLDKFEAEMGQLPLFIDGHQHVHQFPVIRNVLMKVYEERLRQCQCYVRCVYIPGFLYPKGRYYSKILILQVLSGSISFKKELIKRGIPHNSSFSGIYQFQDSANYRTIFPYFLQHITDQGLIMCHPGLNKGELFDSISKSRYDEFLYFDSMQFLSDCRSANVVLK
jgi:predicted glycoside hydrolase/deacetylase ChbG (UPF0249 family)